MSLSEPYITICVECDKRPVQAPSVVYCGQCLPDAVRKAREECEREEAYYRDHPDQRPSIYPDEPGSVGGV